jgi:hypothetical protein
MPKPNYKISPIIITELKSEVLKMATFPIRTKADAGYLALLMKRYGVDGLSESTILRFLNKSKSDHKFYLNTLDKFAVFCGKKDFDEFEKWTNNNRAFGFSYGQLPDEEKPNKSLIKICIHQQQFKPIHEYVEQFDELSIDSQQRIGLEFYQSLITTKKSNRSFYKEFSSSKIVRESFFEKSFDPDFSIPDYDIGFEFYLKNINPEHTINQLQDYIFGNCVLLRHYYTKNNYTKAIKHANNLYNTDGFDEHIENLFIFPKMRFIAYKVFYYGLTNKTKKMTDQVNSLINYCKKNVNNWDYTEQRIAFSCIADTFIHASVSEKYKTELKHTFSNLLTGYSDKFLNHSLNFILKYTDMNGIRTYKRIAGI